MSFTEVLALDCYTFRLLVRDAFIYRMSQSEEGREYLEQAHILTKTEPDRQKLREKVGTNK